jgi:F0F1-type ATP synthase assembly protein I
VTPSQEPPQLPDNRKESGSDWTRAVREAAPYLGLGSSLAALVLVGLGAGYWLDGRLGTRPWLLLLGGVLGIAMALLELYRTVSGRRS